MSRASGIPIYVLSKWRINYGKDNNYRPGAQIGRQNRVFSDEQEENIAAFIRTQYTHSVYVQFIKPGVMVRRRHLQKVLYMLWQSFDVNNRKFAIISASR